MRTFLLHPSLHGALSFAVFLAVAAISSDMNAGFWCTFFLSALSAWFRPCYFQFVFGALLALLLSGLVSFLLIDGSSALTMLPLIAVVFASACLCGFVGVRFVRWAFGRFL
ncbi:hypothetical protein [Undibacterium flavidum]|uniref:Integron gene cassette protein n=1 Tax=Undibacterium flavidum TaxID=2762297 RepID=A0ABR6Y9Z8_9BURK|nr:hypothetical protein [Undibacterium flavidum]MBC3872994.1 hypothetical protein [Undibacterium flavidum]